MPSSLLTEAPGVDAAPAPGMALLSMHAAEVGSIVVQKLALESVAVLCGFGSSRDRSQRHQSGNVEPFHRPVLESPDPGASAPPADYPKPTKYR
jgi:hypothetical protein